MEVGTALDQERQAWQQLWCRDREELADNRERLDRMRLTMLATPEGEDDFRITAADLQRVARKTKAKAGQGPDCITKQIAQQLPAAGWQALARVIQAAFATAILPAQMMHCWV